MSLSSRRYLVTGGAGFIGSHLVDRLLERGDAVVCIDDFNDFYAPSEKRANVAGQLRRPGYRLVEADIRTREQMIALAVALQPTAIIHLAARAGVRPSVRAPELYAQTNILGTLNLLEAARAASVPRVVFGSSSSVYGLNSTAPFREDHPLLCPASPYAATKIAGEALCHSHAHLHELQIVSLRFFTVYGPRQRPDLAIRKFTERILRGESIELYGDGDSSRDYTHVSDIVAGILAALDYDGSGHALFNLGNTAPLRLLDMVRAIEAAVGRAARIVWRPEQPGDVPMTCADITRARTLLDFTPQVGFDDGLRDFVRWLRGAAAA
ncbi:MAG: GDP-mannose 4,6-dehydratase [Myxococcales bacterium]|nr:GDP-mannose 4,6-dehydratase [Myxococcales bacterium]